VTARFDEHLKQKPMGRIYHYTDQKGVKGILETKTIWATNIYYLNDTTEFAYAAGLVEKLAEERSIAGTPGAEILDACVEKLNIISDVRLDIFVACFSERADRLSQWRGYCPEGGFCIGFDYSQLEPFLQQQGFYLAKCIYEEVEQRVLINELFDDTVRRAECEPDLADVAHTFLREFMRLSPVLKDRAFDEEQEWRLISSLAMQARKVRPGRHCFVPYRELEVVEPGHGLDAEIIVGPTIDKELAVNSARDLCRLTNTRDQVRDSAVPYRPR